MAVLAWEVEMEIENKNIYKMKLYSLAKHQKVQIVAL